MFCSNVYYCTKDTLLRLGRFFDYVVTKLDKEGYARKALLQDMSMMLRVDKNGIRVTCGVFFAKFGLDTLEKLNILYNDNGEIKRVDNIVEIKFDKSYFYDLEDVYRLTGGIKIKVNSIDSVVLPPISYVDINLVSLPRGEYKNFLGGKFVELDLVKTFKSLLDTNVVSLLKEHNSGYYKVNGLIDKNDTPFAYKDGRMYDLESLKDVEYRFYYRLLMTLPMIEYPLSEVYLYNDCRWSKVILMPSDKREGEYILVIK